MKHIMFISMILVCVWLMPGGTLANCLDDTPTPPPTATPTPDPAFTCLPCVTEIYIYSITIDDSFGDCYDGDNLIDTGEIVGISITGISRDSCCQGPAQRGVYASCDYEPMVLIDSMQISSPGSMDFLYLYIYSVGDTAQCMDQANFTVDAYADDGMFQAEAHQTETWTIEVDSDDQDDYICDVMPCGVVNTETPQPTMTCTPSATDTPTPSTTPSETPTQTPTDPAPATSTPTVCPPCYPVINIEQINVDDTIGECTDSDGLIDAGETIRITVVGRSLNACCNGPGSVTVEVETDYSHMIQIGYGETPETDYYPFSRYFDYAIDSGAQCGDEANVTVTASVYDSPWTDIDERIIPYLIEVDSNGSGGFNCDTTPCEGTPTPTPIQSVTPTQPALPTPTPHSSDVIVDVILNQTQFNPTDSFVLTMQVLYTGSTSLPNHDLALVIEIAGLYFWYPTWTEFFDCENMDIPPGLTHRDILQFTWPDLQNNHDFAKVYGAVLNPERTSIVGNLDIESFEW